MDIAPKDKVYITQKAFVVNEVNKVLVIKRSATAPSRPGGWDLAGGSLEFGEDPRKGIIREVKEEVGIKVTEVEPIDIFSFLEGDKYTLLIVYFTKIINSKVTLSFEHDDYKWLAYEEFFSFDLPVTYKESIKKLNNRL